MIGVHGRIICGIDVDKAKRIAPIAIMYGDGRIVRKQRVIAASQFIPVKAVDGSLTIGGDGAASVRSPYDVVVKIIDFGIVCEHHACCCIHGNVVVIYVGFGVAARNEDAVACAFPLAYSVVLDGRRGIVDGDVGGTGRDMQDIAVRRSPSLPELNLIPFQELLLAVKVMLVASRLPLTVSCVPLAILTVTPELI
jgi:hypothetical protein